MSTGLYVLATLSTKLGSGMTSHPLSYSPWEKDPWDIRHAQQMLVDKLGCFRYSDGLMPAKTVGLFVGWKLGKRAGLQCSNHLGKSVS